MFTIYTIYTIYSIYTIYTIYTGYYFIKNLTGPKNCYISATESNA